MYSEIDASRRKFAIGYDTHGPQCPEDDDERTSADDVQYMFSHSDLLYPDHVDIASRCEGLFVKRKIYSWWANGHGVFHVYVCDECGSIMDEQSLIEAARLTYKNGEDFCRLP